ncbi:Sterol carrier protein [Nesidiocoris tenuis]|uniref:Sterol carrier protein 2 n=1 Tax=Nesidiocoris tenuis TaxID=355587 RepID=A0ABN7AFR6_9HEMI|nr:Sterol carrier protein [Nesidiocoris tenuis]
MVVPKTKVYVVGVGMTKFYRPGKSDRDYPDLAKEAVHNALEDARITISDVKSACVGYVYGDSTCGQRALYEVGMQGFPIYNVNNNCSTGSTALMLAKQILETGQADCVLALGFEKMERGSLTSKFFDRTNPMDKHIETLADMVEIDGSPLTAQLFGNAGKEHMEKYGSKEEHMAKIAYKNHKHSTNNPYSQFQEEYSMEDITSSPKVFGPLTKLQCCPTSDGAAAAILATEDFVIAHGLQENAVEILGMEMVTDLPSTFNERSCMKLVGYDMTKTAAQRLFAKTGKKVEDVDVVELHDCFSANELITYEALGLCQPGEAAQFIDSGNNTYGGRVVVNPSGGLISKGHPLGATGIAQCSELCWQMRGLAGRRQVPNARLALQHNIGLGGAVVLALYQHGFPERLVSGNRLSVQLTAAVSDDPSSFKVSKAFELLKNEMENDTEKLVESVRGIFCLKVKNKDGKDGMWIINTKGGKGTITYNGTDKPDVTITINDEDITDLLTGKLNPQKAFFQGKLKIQGNMGLALKLTELQKKAGNRIDTLRAKL